MRKQLTRRDFLKATGIATAGMALSACGVKAAESPTATNLAPTAMPTVTPTSNSPTKPIELINERLNTIIASYRDLGNYPFTETQLANLQQSVEFGKVKDEEMGLTRYYWFISEGKLNDLQELELAEMLGYIPLAYSENGEKWIKPGLKDTTDIPIGAEYNEPDEDPIDIRPSTHEFDFGIINSLWGLSAFGDVTTGEKKSVFEFIAINQDGSLILDTSKLKSGWAKYEDFWANRAPYNNRPDIKLIDKSGQNRRLIALPIIYPGDYESDQIPKDFNKFTKDQAISFLDQYVTAFVNEHKDIFFAYVGVTEFGLLNDVLMKQIGPEYIDIVFQSIRTTDSTAKLILEQDGNHVPGTEMTELTLQTATRLKEKEIIDYIASECHLDLTTESPVANSLEEIKSVFASYPVPVYLSSIDINTSAYKDDPRRFLIQAEKIREILAPAVELGTPYISFWGGFPDERSWIVTGGQPDAAPSLWGQGWQEKPMYFTAESVLLKHYLKEYQIGQ
mgnify:CR=1 FL=1